MSTNTPKSTTLSTVPLSSIPGAKSSNRTMPRRNTGGGKSSRGSRRGRDKAANISRNVNAPIDSSLAKATGSMPANR
jgi:hypothetical protein